MKSNLISIAIAAFCCVLSSSVSASNLRGIRFLSATATNYANQGGSGSTLRVSYAADYQGYDHVCQLTYSTDGWKTSNVVSASFSNMSGSSEVWSAAANGAQNATFVYSFACTDLGQTQTIYAATGSLLSYGVTLRDQVRTALARW